MKKSIIRNLTILLFAIMISGFLCFPVQAAETTAQSQQTLKNATVYIVDEANKLTEQEKDSLVKSVEKSTKRTKTKLNVLFLTVQDANGKSVVEYSDDRMEEILAGKGEDNIAFVIDFDNRRTYINTMGKAIQILSDDKIEKALTAGDKYVQNSQYEKCLNAMAIQALSYMNPTKLFLEKFLSRLLLTSVIAIIFTVVWVIFVIRAHNKANIAPSANNYMPEKGYEIRDKQENYVRMYTTRTPRAKQSSGSSGHSGGSSHRSSSGKSHGGGGHSF